jgi:hypothetical protein
VIRLLREKVHHQLVRLENPRAPTTPGLACIAPGFGVRCAGIVDEELPDPMMLITLDKRSF